MRLLFLTIAALTCAASFVGLASGCDRTSPARADATPVALHSHPSPDESCFLCDPSRRDPARLWCGEHARYEDRCWICHPELRDATRPYCDAHGLYEDECPLCNPPPQASQTHGHADGHTHDAAEGLFCAEHRLDERECAICHPELAGLLEPGDGMKVRFASPDSMRKAGVETAPARSAASAQTIRALAETRFNGNRLARITPLAGGVITRVLVDLGDHVREGTPLLELHSAELASAKAAHLTASVTASVAEENLARRRALHERDLASTGDYLAAEGAARLAQIELAASRRRLQSLGLTDETVSAIETADDDGATLVVRSPFEGEIVERAAVIGQAVSPGDAPLTIADLSTIWIELSVPITDGHRLRVGAPVTARFRAIPGATFDAEVVWIDATVDPRSRMIRARAVCDNTDRRLKAGFFGEATLAVESAPAVRVPRDAVQEIAGQSFVFVRVEDDLLDARRVEVARDPGPRDHVDLTRGVRDGEPVVVTGSFTVLSEMLKSRLGAGCVDH